MTKKQQKLIFGIVDDYLNNPMTPQPDDYDEVTDALCAFQKIAEELTDTCAHCLEPMNTIIRAQHHTECGVDVTR